MRNPREAIDKFGLSSHPRVASQMHQLGSTTGGQKLKHSSLLWPGLVEIWYRLSGVHQFRSVETVTKANGKAAAEMAKLKNKLKQGVAQKRLTSREQHIRHFMRAHLVKECQHGGPGFMYNLACSTASDSDYQLCVSTLEDHVQTAIGQSAPKFPAASRTLIADVFDEEDAMEEAFMETSPANAVPVSPHDDGAPATPPLDALPAFLQDVHFKEALMLY